MMPPPLHACNGLASPATQRTVTIVCTVKFLKLFATRQHQFDFDCYVLLYPAALSKPAVSLLTTAGGRFPQIFDLFTA